MNRNLATLSDAELLVRFNEGTTDAFGVLAMRYHQPLYRMISSLLRDRTLADDLVQDTHLKAFEAMQKGRYTHTGVFKPWIMRIGRNLVLDYFRKNKHDTSANSGTIEDLIVIDDQKNPEEKVIADETVRIVYYLIEKLPRDQREVVYLQRFGNFTFREIAIGTNVSINTSLGRMHHAMRNLRKMIAPGEHNTTSV